MRWACANIGANTTQTDNLHLIEDDPIIAVDPGIAEGAEQGPCVFGTLVVKRWIETQIVTRAEIRPI
jgi:hypothetical protein